jgi:biopolymer transport protein ExbD
MRLRRSGLKKARIEIIPMIDTIFFLLVFFMISTLSMEHYRGLRVNLPKAASGTQAPADNATITLTQDGGMYLNKDAIERAALTNALRIRLERNPELLVLVNADGAVPHRYVVEVMDDARRAGVTKVAIAVKPKEGR